MDMFRYVLICIISIYFSPVYEFLPDSVRILLNIQVLTGYYSSYDMMESVWLVRQ